jgi:uncharacterized oxidoreductase
MNLKEKNTILITGGGSGLGRGLAEAFHKLGQKVIIAGRRRDVLEAVAKENPGLEFEVFDVQDTAAIPGFAAGLTAKFPALNVVVHMAGIMTLENLKDGADLAAVDRVIATNLTAPLHLTAALTPHLKQQASATIMTVTSGLAFLPLVSTPTYCATKAAIHSWTLSLRYQLKGTSIEVVELPPPYVQTELLGPQQASDPRAMRLDDFIREVMEILTTQPDVKEVLVKNVYPLRFAGDFNSEKFDGFFEQFNNAMAVH